MESRPPTMDLDHTGKYNSIKFCEPYYMLEAPVCSICLGKVFENFTVTKCGHVFHFNCITASLNRKPECPNCRRSPMTSAEVIEVRPPLKKKNIYDDKDMPEIQDQLVLDQGFNMNMPNDNDMLCAICLKG